MLNSEIKSSFVTIKQGDEVLAFVKKDQIIGACYAVDDEWVLLLHLKDGRTMSVGVGSRGDSDRLLELISDLGWT